MTSPITATVSHAAAQASPPSPAQGVRAENSAAHMSQQQIARTSAIAAERQGSQMSDEKRVIKRQPARTEAGFAAQHSHPKLPKKSGAVDDHEEEQEQESDDGEPGRHVDVEV